MFLNNIGYNLENGLELKSQLLNNTDFSKLILSNFMGYSFTVEALTILKDKNKNKDISVVSVWQVHENKTLTFVTLILGEKHVKRFYKSKTK